MPVNLEDRYGSKRAWRESVRDRHEEWPPEHFRELDYPFTAPLEVPKQYMAGEGMMDVFSEEFRERVHARCREFVEPLAEDPNLVGYHFTHNPPWHHANPSSRSGSAR
jgi:hypothetical protein